MGHPAVSVTVAISVALALTLFGTTQVMAVVAVPTSLETATPSPTSTFTPSPTPTTIPAPDPSASSTATPSATPSPTPGAAPSASLQTFAAPGDHHVLARIEGSNFQANYLPVDQPVPDASPFQTFRVRFRLHNAGTVPITTTPRLEYRAEGGTYLVVSEKPTLGIPFHVDREWVPSLGLSGGTVESPLGADISASDLRMGTDSGLAVNGHHSMGANPDQPITLPSDSYTEEEFTVTLSMDARYLTGYQLRITNGGTPLTGTDVATIRVGGEPAVRLSPGQQRGVAVAGPKKKSSAISVYPLLSASAIAANTASASVSPVSGVSAVSAVYRSNAVAHPLVAAALSAATYAATIHGPYDMTSDQCATCHRAHVAKGPNLMVKGSQSDLCFMCHDGSGATANVQAEYHPLVARPANDSTTRDYYSHDAEAPSNHTNSGLDEFAGVSNRHSACADCHNSHKARATPDSTQTADPAGKAAGWDASGRLAGVSGVSVLNGPAETAPTYTFLSGSTDAAVDEDRVTNANPINVEYQLCFKCHSGFTKLLPPIAGKPSLDALDKGIELNPANPSFHPIEAPGTNTTPKMDLNLAATSPFKLWDFNSTSTIRCLNCHASGSTAGPNPPAAETVPPPPLPLPGTALAPHASSNRGILLRNYQDRVLKSGIDTATTKAAYSAGDFALCYVCHGEEPYVNATGDAASNATNFSLHGQHLTLLAGKGTGGTDIDKPGDGQGNAICAECHFRIHSTTYTAKTKDAAGTDFTQAIPGSRLVNFAPNVQPNGVTLSWTPASTTAPGSCTLTCHSHTHTGAAYPAIPAP